VFVLPARGRDNLDSTRGGGWPPDSKWLAFNPVNQDNLLIISLAGRKNFLLRPTGEILLDTSNVIAPTGSEPARTTSVARIERGMEKFALAISSPGRGKLEALEWSPKSDVVAYKIDRYRRATFSVLDQSVTGIYAPNEPLPWMRPDARRVTFDFERATTNRPSRYVIRVVTADLTPVRELSFEHPREVQRLSLLRGTESTFLTPDGQTLIYPRFHDGRWQLVTEPVTDSAGPQPLTEPAPGAPYEWRLSPNGKYLAVVEGASSLAIGPLTDWSKAERVTYSNLTMSVEWSPDGRFLAANDRRVLYLLEFDPAAGKVVGGLQTVYHPVSAQYWGWRGSRLIFNPSAGHPADLLFLDTADGDRIPRVLVKARQWNSAPAVRTISPNGKTYVCLFMEISGTGQYVHEIWRIQLEPTAQWELVHRWIPEGER
jgi:hypothetical protein